MFMPSSDMPASLRAHVRYPEDYFNIQAQVFATYHVTNPGLLYNKGNQWDIPNNVSISGTSQMNPYYMIMRLPGQTQEEFVLILPFVPNGRTNMIAWLGAQSDQPNYGKAVSFQFPSSLTVYGPAQVEAAVNQDPTISAQRTLWGQQGSTVIFGNLLTVPIENRCSTCSRCTWSRRRPSCRRSSASSSSTARRRRTPNMPDGAAAERGHGADAGRGADGHLRRQRAARDRRHADADTEPERQRHTDADTDWRQRRAEGTTHRAGQHRVPGSAGRPEAANLTEYGKQIDALGKTLAKLSRCVI